MISRSSHRRFLSVLSLAFALGTAACGPSVIVHDPDEAPPQSDPDPPQSDPDPPQSDPDPPQSDPAPLCGPGKSIFLDGAALGPTQQAYAFHGMSFRYEGMSQSPTEITLGFEDSGVLFFKDLHPADDQSTLQSETSWLRMPWNSPTAGVVFCADHTEVVQSGELGDGGIFAAELSGLRKLGACPGSPVSSDAVFCDSGCEHVIEGVIDGVSLTLQGTGGFGDVETTLDGGGHLSNQSGGLMIWMPDNSGLEGGSIYCVEALTQLPGDPERFQLEGVSRLGSCSDAGLVQGTVDACVSF